jgi:hypothetical protein
MDERMMQLAQRAAELLPVPPAAHDAFGYLAWEELVMSTARRVHQLAGAPQLHPGHSGRAPACVALEPDAVRVSAGTLLRLGALLAVSDDTTACEGVLARAVAVRPAVGRSQHPRHHRLVAHGRPEGLRPATRTALRGSVALSPRL